jgi:hypothetical protein
MFPVRLRKRLMDLACPAWFMWCASSLLDGQTLGCWLLHVTGFKAGYQLAGGVKHSRCCPAIFHCFTCPRACRNALSMSMPSGQAIMVPAI